MCCVCKEDNAGAKKKIKKNKYIYIGNIYRVKREGVG